MTIQMELARVLIRETDDTHIVELREANPTNQAHPRIFPIVIGITEAAAIERRLMGQQPPRPQTHELLDSVIAELGYELNRIEITDLRNHTFFAKLFLRKGSEMVEIDARPSDAIALGSAHDVPIYVAEHVLDEVCGDDSF
ncbi:MAG: bifunctional nuclease family protein [Phycisphaerales bacterium JB063]